MDTLKIKTWLGVCEEMLLEARANLAKTEAECVREIYKHSIIRLESKIEAFKMVLGDL
jgi:cob(I)alamin adenosyltransferase